MSNARGTRVPPSHVTSLHETNLKRRTACTVRTINVLRKHIEKSLTFYCTNKDLVN
jgi:hypothetical protein